MRRSASRRLLAGVALAAALASTACGARGRLALPVGDGQADPDGPAVFARAATACRNVRTLTAEIALSGRANGRRVRGRLLAGVERPDRLRLEALAPFGAPVFVLVARDGRGRLWIPREQSAVKDAPVAELVDAVAGLSPSGDELVALLSGCVVPADASPAQVRRFNGGWRSIEFAGGTTVWLVEDARGARIVAGRLGPGASRGGLQVEYAAHLDGLPREIRLVGGGPKPSTDLTLRLSGVELNADLGEKAFELALPDDVRAVSVDELRRAGVLGSGT